jgi:hypothetical protein
MVMVCECSSFIHSIAYLFISFWYARVKFIVHPKLEDMIDPIVWNAPRRQILQLLDPRHGVPKWKPVLMEPQFTVAFAPASPPRRFVGILNPGWQNLGIHNPISTKLDVFIVRQTQGIIGNCAKPRVFRRLEPGFLRIYKTRNENLEWRFLECQPSKTRSWAWRQAGIL